MLMMVTTGLWVMSLPVMYLYLANKAEASITRKGDKIITSQGEEISASVFDGVVFFGFLCWGICPTSGYGLTMLVLLIILLVMKSSEKKAASTG